MTQIGQTIRHAARGPVVASPDAWGLCDSLFTGTETESGTTLTGTHDTLPPVAFAGTDTVPVEVSSATFESYLPAVVRTHLHGGLGAFLAEHRMVSVLFIKITGVLVFGEGWAERLHQAIAELQTHLYAHGGALDKVSVDDKGVVVVAAFGLPSARLEYKPAAAVEAAVAIDEALRAQGSDAAIGVTTGKVFCGPVGSEVRREYTMIGGRGEPVGPLDERGARGHRRPGDPSRRQGRGRVDRAAADAGARVARADPLLPPHRPQSGRGCEGRRPTPRLRGTTGRDVGSDPTAAHRAHGRLLRGARRGRGGGGQVAARDRGVGPVAHRGHRKPHRPLPPDPAGDTVRGLGGAAARRPRAPPGRHPGRPDAGAPASARLRPGAARPAPAAVLPAGSGSPGQRGHDRPDGVGPRRNHARPHRRSPRPTGRAGRRRARPRGRPLDRLGLGRAHPRSDPREARADRGRHGPSAGHRGGPRG